MMDFVVHAERLGEVRDLETTGQPALDRHIAAQVIRRPVHDPWRIGGGAGGWQFRRHDRNLEHLLELDVAVEVVVGKRVFIPVEVEILNCPPDAQRLGVIVGPGGIEHQPKVAAHSFAHSPADLDIQFRNGRRVDLVRGPAGFLVLERFLAIGLRRIQDRGTGIGRDAVAARTHQAVNGQPGGSSGKIPEGHINGADCANHLSPRVAAGTGHHRAPQPFTGQGVFARQHRLQTLHDEGGITVRRGV